MGIHPAEARETCLRTQQVFLILDNLSAHHSKLVKKWPGVLENAMGKRPEKNSTRESWRRRHERT